ncbi:MAG: M23 family metallopeptidase [Hyphomicrobiaceae bacterium]
MRATLALAVVLWSLGLTHAMACPAANEPGEAPAGLARPMPRDIGTGFGMQLHPLLGVRKQHTGVDFVGPIGEPVLAVAAGVVIEALYKSQNGNFVAIRHRGGLSTTYSHLSRITVKAGDCLERGQVIGHVGSTGLVAEPHLHFEVLKDGVFVDPAPLLLPIPGR